MSFKLSEIQDLQIQHKVTFHLGTGADAKKLEFNATFQLLDDENVQSESQEGDAPFVRKVLKNWDGILDDDDQQLEFNTENLDQLIKLSWWRTAVIDAYYYCAATAGRKNS